jgi:hypothetical protein
MLSGQKQVYLKYKQLHIFGEQTTAAQLQEQGPVIHRNYVTRISMYWD